MAEEETDRAQAADFLANELARETQSYLERGRRVQGLTDIQMGCRLPILASFARCYR